MKLFAVNSTKGIPFAELKFRHFSQVARLFLVEKRRYDVFFVGY